MSIPPSPVAVGATRATRIRQKFADGQLVRAAGAHDALTALLAEEAGFDAVWSSSFAISAGYGLPDVSLLGMAEYLAASTAMHRSVEVPVVADCDTGFGGNLNAAFAMMQFEAAGVAAVCIEDKVFPKRNSFVEVGQELLDADEFARKLAVAARARSHPDTLLIARTETFICGLGVDEALRRSHSYVDAGADAILVHSKASDQHEVVSFLQRWQRRAPVVIVPTTYPGWRAEEAAKAGVSMVIYANQGLRATVTAVRETWEAILKHGSSAPVEAGIASVREIFKVSRLRQWLELDS
jgi:phosphoenolpyruvate phosphomutase